MSALLSAPHNGAGPLAPPLRTRLLGGGPLTEQHNGVEAETASDNAELAPLAAALAETPASAREENGLAAMQPQECSEAGAGIKSAGVQFVVNVAARQEQDAPANAADQMDVDSAFPALCLGTTAESQCHIEAKFPTETTAADITVLGKHALAQVEQEIIQIQAHICDLTALISATSCSSCHTSQHLAKAGNSEQCSCHDEQLLRAITCYNHYNAQSAITGIQLVCQRPRNVKSRAEMHMFNNLYLACSGQTTLHRSNTLVKTAIRSFVKDLRKHIDHLHRHIKQYCPKDTTRQARDIKSNAGRRVRSAHQNQTVGITTANTSKQNSREATTSTPSRTQPIRIVGQKEENDIAYYDRRYRELAKCVKPTATDILDAEMHAMSAVCKWYMVADLPPRHDPPDCLITDNLVIFGIAVTLEMQEWSPAVIEIFMSLQALSKLLDDAMQLMTAKYCVGLLGPATTDSFRAKLQEYELAYTNQLHLWFISAQSVQEENKGKEASN